MIIVDDINHIAKQLETISGCYTVNYKVPKDWLKELIDSYKLNLKPNETVGVMLTNDFEIVKRDIIKDLYPLEILTLEDKILTLNYFLCNSSGEAYKTLQVYCFYKEKGKLKTISGSITNSV